VRIAPNAEEDQALGLTDVPPKVVWATPNGGDTLAVRFADGLSGVADCSAMIRGPNAGVFGRLEAMDALASVHVEHGAVTWDGGLDLAPDAMHEAIARDGRWVLV
jgi:Protein of unknown function (DUF2442)